MDILIALLIALAQGVTAILGWRVTVKPLSSHDKKRLRRYTGAFVTATLVSFVAPGLGTYLARQEGAENRAAQKALPREVASQVILAMRNETPAINASP